MQVPLDDAAFGQLTLLGRFYQEDGQDRIVTLQAAVSRGSTYLTQWAVVTKTTVLRSLQLFEPRAFIGCCRMGKTRQLANHSAHCVYARSQRVQ